MDEMDGGRFKYDFHSEFSHVLALVENCENISLWF